MLEKRNVRSGFFEHEDFLALRGALPDYAQVAVTLAYYSGMRMGEVFSLNWNQVNWTEGKLYLRAQDTKTDSPRVLYLRETFCECCERGNNGVTRSGLSALGFVIEVGYASNPSSIPGAKLVSG